MPEKPKGSVSIVCIIKKATEELIENMASYWRYETPKGWLNTPWVKVNIVLKTILLSRALVNHHCTLL